MNEGNDDLQEITARRSGRWPRRRATGSTRTCDITEFCRRTELTCSGSVEKVGVVASPPVGPSPRTLDHPAMLRRLQPVRKLEARLDGPPGREQEGRELLAGGRRGLPRARLVGELGHGALREVPRARPLLVSVAHDGARQTPGDATDGNICITRDPRFISLLVRRRFQWLGGKSK